ncbi:MAG: RecX family transcriptional regulator [Eggerthellaceae bacterium]|nr:RecX family transcriptional regulator [Eggerthellaceae bacterium]
MSLPDKEYGASHELGLDAGEQEKQGHKALADKGEEAAFKKIMRLCAYRDRASREIKTRLLREGFEPEGLERALDRALSCGIIDDSRFADSFVRGRLNAGKGRKGIELELRRLGLDPASIKTWPEGCSAQGDGDAEENELNRAIRLLEMRPPKATNKREAAYKLLIRKGFSASQATSAARIWFENLENNG